MVSAEWMPELRFERNTTGLERSAAAAFACASMVPLAVESPAQPCPCSIRTTASPNWARSVASNSTRLAYRSGGISCSRPKASSSRRSRDRYCTCCSMPVRDESAYCIIDGSKSRRNGSAVSPSAKGSAAATAGRLSTTRRCSATLAATSERRIDERGEDRLTTTPHHLAPHQRPLRCDGWLVERSA